MTLLCVQITQYDKKCAYRDIINIYIQKSMYQKVLNIVI